MVGGFKSKPGMGVFDSEKPEVLRNAMEVQASQRRDRNILRIEKEMREGVLVDEGDKK